MGRSKQLRQLASIYSSKKNKNWSDSDIKAYMTKNERYRMKTITFEEARDLSKANAKSRRQFNKSTEENPSYAQGMFNTPKTIKKVKAKVYDDGVNKRYKDVYIRSRKQPDKTYFTSNGKPVLEASPELVKKYTPQQASPQQAPAQRESQYKKVDTFYVNDKPFLNATPEAAAKLKSGFDLIKTQTTAKNKTEIDKFMLSGLSATQSFKTFNQNPKEPVKHESKNFIVQTDKEISNFLSNTAKGQIKLGLAAWGGAAKARDKTSQILSGRSNFEDQPNKFYPAKKGEFKLKSDKWHKDQDIQQAMAVDAFAIGGAAAVGAAATFGLPVLSYTVQAAAIGFGVKGAIDFAINPNPKTAAVGIISGVGGAYGVKSTYFTATPKLTNLKVKSRPKSSFSAVASQSEAEALGFSSGFKYHNYKNVFYESNPKGTSAQMDLFGGAVPKSKVDAAIAKINENIQIAPQPVYNKKGRLVGYSEALGKNLDTLKPKNIEGKTNYNLLKSREFTDVSFVGERGINQDFGVIYDRIDIKAKTSNYIPVSGQKRLTNDLILTRLNPNPITSQFIKGKTGTVNPKYNFMGEKITVSRKDLSTQNLLAPKSKYKGKPSNKLISDAWADKNTISIGNKNPSNQEVIQLINPKYDKMIAESKIININKQITDQLKTSVKTQPRYEKFDAWSIPKAQPKAPSSKYKIGDFKATLFADRKSVV